MVGKPPINTKWNKTLYHFSKSSKDFLASEIDFSYCNNASNKVPDSLFCLAVPIQPRHLKGVADRLLTFVLKEGSRMVTMRESEMVPFKDFFKWVEENRTLIDVLEIVEDSHHHYGTYYAILNKDCLKDP